MILIFVVCLCVVYLFYLIKICFAGVLGCLLWFVCCACLVVLRYVCGFCLFWVFDYCVVGLQFVIFIA